MLPSKQIPRFPRPEWIPETVWRDWRRCVLRGYRRPAPEGASEKERLRLFMADAAEYACDFGCTPQQRVTIEATESVGEETKTVVFATAAMIGQKEFVRLKARVAAGLSDPRLHVVGEAVYMTVVFQGKIIERRKR